MYEFETLLHTLSEAKEKSEYTQTSNDDQNTTYVFVSKATQAAYMNLNHQHPQGIQPIRKVHVKIGQF